MARTTLPADVRRAVDAIEDLKGQAVVVLDLHGVNDATDYFVLASGTSEAHVRGIAESVMAKMDNLFHPETRSFYQLERRWSDALELPLGTP
jgi:ribosome-associated protein